MSQQHLCFYSTRCRFSQNFLEELSRTPFAKEFRFICVDQKPGTGIRPQLPPYVKAVPTLMIQGEKEPRTDSAVMNWISERRLQTKGGGGGGGLGGGSLEGLGGFDGGPVAFGGEMFSSGDEQFAFIGDDTSTSKGAMVRLFGNMAALDDINSMVVPDGRASNGPAAAAARPGGAGGKPPSAKSQALDDAFTRMQMERDKMMGPPGGRRM